MSVDVLTRQELYLKYLAGDTSVTLPEPVTRIEKYWWDIAQKVNSDLEVDDEFSDVSTNPLQNKVITKAIDTINDQIADILYVPIDITSISHSVGKKEMGEVITEITVSWTINKEPVSQTLRGEELDPSVRSSKVQGLNISVTNNERLKLVVTDERNNTDEARTDSIVFVNGIYGGSIEDGTTVDSSVVRGLTKVLPSSNTSRSCSFTIDSPTNVRAVVALPSRLGNPTFKDKQGFDAAMYKSQTIEFENHRGYTESYDVWLSNKLINNKNGAVIINVS